jgi:hypothetical protein
VVSAFSVLKLFVMREGLNADTPRETGGPQRLKLAGNERAFDDPAIVLNYRGNFALLFARRPE